MSENPSKILTIEGLPGTGKTHSIREFLEQRDNNKSLLLSFNRSLVSRTRVLMGEISFPPRNVKTIHSLCYSVLKFADSLPENFLNENKNPNYKLLIIQILKISPEMIKRFLGDIEILVVDEYQDLDSDLIRVIKYLFKIFNCQLILCGDRMQEIYYFYDKIKKNNFDNISNCYEITPARNFLNDYKRSKSYSIPIMLNNYYSYIGTESDYLYKNVQDPKNKSAKPRFRWCRDWKEEIDNIIVCHNRGDRKQTSIVLCRDNHHKSEIETILRDKGIEDLKVSTIHSFKGKESDNVYIVSVPDLNKEKFSEQKVWGVAFSRARKFLHMSSSHPKFDLELMFLDSVHVFGAYQNNPIIRSKMKIKTNAQWKASKLNSMSIDSVSFRINYTDAPFNRHFKSESAPLKKSFKNRFIKKQNRKYEDFKYSISFNKRYKFYTFEFIDMNILRRSSFNDLNVLKICRYIISDYFDHRIEYDKISTVRLDICIFNQNDSKEDYINFVKKEINDLNKSNHKHTIINHESKNINQLSDSEIYNSTLYCNSYSANSRKKITYKMYCSNNKENNQIPFPFLLKQEIQIVNIFDRDTIVPNVLGNINSIYDTISGGRDLVDLFKGIMKKRFY